MSADLIDLAVGRGPNDCPFGLCDGSGFVVEEPTNTAMDCRCRATRIARRRAASLEGRIPKRYRSASFDQQPVASMPDAVVSAVRTYVRNLRERIADGRGIWFVGDVGTGKTTLAMIVSAASLNAGYSTAIYSLPRLLNLIRDEVGTENSLLDLLDRLSSVDLLHIDDLGAQHTTPWRLEQLYSIVDARYQAGKAIVATTNLMPPALAEQMGRQILNTVTEDGSGRTHHERREVSSDAGEVVGQRIVSRLVEMCGDPLPLYGEDKRQTYIAAHADVRGTGLGSVSGL